MTHRPGPARPTALLSELAWLRRVATVLLLTLLGAAAAQAGTHWPMPDQVVAETKGRDAEDTSARQAAALYQLKGLVTDLHGFKLPPAMQQIAAGYARASGELLSAAKARLSTPEAAGRTGSWPQWYSAYTRYSLDSGLRQTLVQRYLDPQDVAALRTKDAQRAQALQAAQQARVASERQAAGIAAPLSRPGLLDMAAQEGVPRLVFLSLGIGLPLWTLLALRRELRRFGLDRQDPLRLYSAGQLHELQATTGIVRGAVKRQETRTQVSGGGSRWVGNGYQTDAVSVSTQTIVHDDFFLQRADGSEREVRVAGFDLALREGQTVTAVAAFPAAKAGADGRWLLVRNHASRSVSVGDAPLSVLARAGGIWILPLTCAAAFWGYPLAYVLGVAPSYLWSHMVLWVAWAGGILIASFFAMMPICIGLTRWRARRMHRELLARLVPALDQALAVPARSVPASPIPATAVRALP